MKYGLKMWSRNENVIEQGIELIDRGMFDYIEVMPLPGSKPDTFMEFDVDYIIHFTTENFGFNLSDVNKSEINNELIELNFNWANKLDASKIIIHPAFGDINYLVDQLEDLNDDRLITENMPVEGINGENMIGATLKDLRKILTVLESFCLDVCHAFKAAKSLDRDFKSYFEDLIGLKPTVVHLSDSALNVLYDEHLKLGEGEVPYKFIKDKLGHLTDPLVTFETPRKNLNSFAEDIENLNYFLEL